MNRNFAFMLAVVAAFAFTSQGAKAGPVDQRVAATAIGVGAASTAAYFAINDWKWKWGNGRGFTRLGAIGLTTIGCAALSPMVATVLVDRPLTMREGHVLIGSCLVPIIGGLLVNAAYDAHPEWEPDAAPAPKKRHAKK